MKRMKAFDCGMLIDGIADEPIRDAVILVKDGITEEIGPRESVSVPDNVERIDHSGEIVIPGLIDAHVHLTGKQSMNPFEALTTGRVESAARATADCRKLLDTGFTTVRDVGSGTALGLKAAINTGDVPGPRVFSSGPPINQTGGHIDAHFLPIEWLDIDQSPHTRSNWFSDRILADGPAECRKAARRNIREGVDLLKIATTGGVLSEKDHPRQQQYTDDEIAAITEEAHRVGIDVASHAQGSEGVKSALRNGVDTIEHGFYLDDEAIEMMLETDATFVPTLSVMHQIVTEGPDHGMPEYGLRKAREAWEAHIESTRSAYEAGVPIALATDFLGNEFTPYGKENLLEAELFVEKIGMTEMDVVKAATSVAARTIPDDRVGGIKPGNHADFVAVDIDPLSDISALRETNTVYKGGLPGEASAPSYREEQ